jgi:putative endonuclease
LTRAVKGCNGFRFTLFSFLNREPLNREPSNLKYKNIVKPDFWFVYVLECANGAFYTGITKNVPARLKAHNNGTGARYTRSFGPAKLVWTERRTSKSLALKREARIKSFPKSAKTALIRNKKKK